MKGSKKAKSNVNPHEITKVEKSIEVPLGQCATKVVEVLAIDEQKHKNLKVYLSEQGIYKMEQFVGLFLTPKFFSGDYPTNSDLIKIIRGKCSTPKYESSKIQVTKKMSNIEFYKMLFEALYGPLTIEEAYINILKDNYDTYKDMEDITRDSPIYNNILLCYKILNELGGGLSLTPASSEKRDFKKFLDTWKEKINK